MLCNMYAGAWLGFQNCADFQIRFQKLKTKGVLYMKNELFSKSVGATAPTLSTYLVDYVPHHGSALGKNVFLTFRVKEFLVKKQSFTFKNLLSKVTVFHLQCWLLGIRFYSKNTIQVG